MFYFEKVISGIDTNYHDVVTISHNKSNGCSDVIVEHFLDDESVFVTSHSHDLDFSLNFESAEEWVQTLDEYIAPVIDVTASIEDLVWQPDYEYDIDDYVIYDSVIYKVIQAHTSQDDWTPDVAPSLFAKALTKPNEVLPWEQPDSTNPYMKGDRVLFNDKTYESLIDNNVWSPEAYPAGWKEV